MGALAKLLKSWDDFRRTPSIWPGRGDNRGLNILGIQRIKLTDDPAIFGTHRGEIVDSLSPKVAPARSVVYVVENHGRYSDDGMSIISIHSTRIAACRVKGRELRLQLANNPPELCTQRTDYRDWSVKDINWWYSEFDDICIREVVVDLYPYWP